MTLMNKTILSNQIDSGMLVHNTMSHRSQSVVKSSQLKLKASQEAVKYLTHQLDLAKSIEWIELPSMFISGWTQGQKVTKFESLKNAQAMCHTVTDCSGVTKLGNGVKDEYELRSGLPQVSSDQETSWLRPGL